MSAREDILAGLHAAHAVGDETPEELVDAFRTEVLAGAADELWARTLLHDDCVCVAELRRLAAAGADPDKVEGGGPR